MMDAVLYKDCLLYTSQADQYKQSSAYGVYNAVMAFDPVECGFQVINKQGAEDKRQSKSHGVSEQHQRTLEDMALLRGEDQRRAQKSSYAGCPATVSYTHLDVYKRQVPDLHSGGASHSSDD